MSITHSYLKGRDFAEQAANALADLKRADPKGWKEQLVPYKAKIEAEATTTHTSTTSAVLHILNRINNSAVTEKVLRMQHFFYLAAYVDML